MRCGNRHEFDGCRITLQILDSAYLAHIGRQAPLFSIRYEYDWMWEFAMRVFDRVPSESLERREMHLILLACSAIMVLAAGLALFMYPVVFSQTPQTPFVPTRTMSIAFIGFCVLSVLLAVYLVDRQATIRRLRQQLGEERRRATEALKQASADLLGTLANFSSFQDKLAMEYRRAAAGKQNLSALVVTTKLHEALSDASLSTSVLGDAAKAISRKLREEDSIYILTQGHFGVILPGVDATVAKRVSARLVEGLTDAAGASNRFSFEVHAISYPEQASSAHDLELAVTGLLPEDSLDQTMTREALASK
jgi:GGDEF domain-containing protein